jgi:hypothetical protein
VRLSASPPLAPEFEEPSLDRCARVAAYKIINYSRISLSGTSYSQLNRPASSKNSLNNGDLYGYWVQKARMKVLLSIKPGLQRSRSKKWMLSQAVIHCHTHDQGHDEDNISRSLSWTIAFFSIWIFFQRPLACINDEVYSPQGPTIAWLYTPGPNI